MTTNSFGGGLPPFDFNQQVKPAVSRLSRSMPLLARLVPVVTVAAFAYYASSEIAWHRQVASSIRTERQATRAAAAAAEDLRRAALEKSYGDRHSLEDLARAINTYESTRSKD